LHNNGNDTFPLLWQNRPNQKEAVMQPRIKMGLIVGVVGLVMNTCVSGFIGLCGPFASLIAGAVAGFFAANQEKLPTKGDGAKAGAIAGAIAGGLMIIGQIIGGVVALTIQQNTGSIPFIGNISSDIGSQAMFYVTGMATGLCFGLFGTAFAAGAGAGAGYLATPDQPPMAPPI
jgi:hypothetical protein